jgi:hypothetical protein
MATIEKYVNDSTIGNDGHSGDHNASQPWRTIQHGVDWFAANKQIDDVGILNLTGAFLENVSLTGKKYSNIVTRRLHSAEARSRPAYPERNLKLTKSRNHWPCNFSATKAGDLGYSRLASTLTLAFRRRTFW